jgi:hypothetical protein
VAKLARATTGSITRNIEEMRRMVIEEPRTSSVAMRVSSRAEELALVVASGEPVVRAGLVALVVPVVRVASVVPEDPAVPVALAVLEDPAVRAALVVPEDPVVRVVPENPVVRVVQENPVALAVPENPAVPGPETALAAVPERGPVAVPLRTKSVTAPHPRGLVPLLAGAEDLAAAAETTRDPAATEAATAWVAAV